MEEGSSYVGMDTSKKSLWIARQGVDGKWLEWEIANEPTAIRRMVRKLQREVGAAVKLCYEAGPCGYALQRQIESLGASCKVVAPSLIPVKPGQRIKTDRRDARKLAELFRAGLLTEVRPPTPEEESVRDLVRCREDLVEDRTRCRHRLAKMLLRRGYLNSSGRTWGLAHRRWLKTIRWDREADRIAFDDYLLALEQAEDRLSHLEDQLLIVAGREPYRSAVGILGCFRGIATITAMTIVAELHGIERFGRPRQLMAYLGLVPREHSSSEKIARGSITKAGNAHVRRVLIEAAHHYRHRPAIGTALRTRRENQPGWAIALADRAQQRLHHRFRKLLLRGKNYGKLIVAVARELVGFLWAALQPRHA